MSQVTPSCVPVASVSDGIFPKAPALIFVYRTLAIAMSKGDKSFIKQPWCLRFKVDYIIQEDTGLAEIRIVVVCGGRRMHALRISVDPYDSTATKVFEFTGSKVKFFRETVRIWLT
ncbi:hypothetical protein pipiens_013198 [Culex pipiens pipiens]|uniref:Uncharacterized protein n=1 Tax=Culex pipiens pipiens TaxID=38569 RepID=A0ABD1CZE2_CULPP